MSDNAGSIAHLWREGRISDVGSVTVGGTPSTSVAKYWDGEVPWMTSGDIHLRRIFNVPGRITQLGLRHSNAALVSPPTVAVALAGQGKTRGTVALVLCELCTNQSVALLSTHPSFLDTSYLFYNLTFRYEELRSRSAGGGRAGLSKQLLEQIPVPLPALPEQSKIAEILSTVDRAIEQTEALIAKQQRIKTGLMQDLLTRGIDEHGNLRSEKTHKFRDSPQGRIPVEWDVQPVGFHLSSIDQGRSPDCGNDPAPLGQWGVLKTTAVVWEGFQDYENKLLPPHFKPLARFEIQVSDVLMTRGGPNSRVGVVIFVHETRPQLMLSDKLYRLVPKSTLDAEFLVMALASDRTQRHLSTLKTGLAESQTNISQEIVRRLEIQIPPKNEQVQIAKIIRSVSNRLNSDIRQLAKLRSLKTALMQDLLTGKRRVTPLLSDSQRPKHENGQDSQARPPRRAKSR